MEVIRLRIENSHLVVSNNLIKSLNWSTKDVPLQIRTFFPFLEPFFNVVATVSVLQWCLLWQLTELPYWN